MTTIHLFALVAACMNADPNGLNVGDKVPAFQSIDDTGKEWSSQDHVGKNIVVLYFYPADLTGGCTAQACAFRDHQPQLKEAGVEVIGVSGDSAKNHQIFKKVHNLNFTLLADEKGELAKLFGVPTKAGGSIDRVVDDEQVTLTRDVTTARWTFVIDKSGKIVYRDTEVKAADDAEKILSVVKELKSKES